MSVIYNRPEKATDDKDIMTIFFLVKVKGRKKRT